ncbi:M48 family metallopeptidase [Litoribacillus peritrichatus]|uniref:M48 family metallopeptidase n=1 Tax=Litoribacillus peritrichatus TaxID=718191 RepID=A0ABP7MX97_9GAMM
MDFFEHQAKATRTSKFLVLNYCIALMILTVGFNFAGLITWTFLTQPEYQGSFKQLIQLWLESRYSWQVTLATVIFVGSVSLATWFTMRQGGGKIAKMMGGRIIPANTHNKDEKRLLNVVEEMALASGLPVPELYVMDNEHGLNAFAAGYSPNEAAICVTRGLILSLNRDEIQGVIAHEFSHILNGDMRMNVKLMSILSGLIAVGQLGRWLIESGFHSGHDSKGGNILFILIGILIWALGSLGVLCSRIIKAAISRQREFLADASAVQFTRQTYGIASALYKISTHRYGSNLISRHAEDLSHMCIGQTMNIRFANALASHPPIEDRITRIEPHFITKASISSAQQRKEQFEAQQTQNTAALPSVSASTDTVSNITAPGSPTPEIQQPSGAITSEEMIEFVSPQQEASINHAIDSIGITDDHSVTAAKEVLSSLNPSILAALHQPDYAQYIVLLLLAHANSQPKQAKKLITEGFFPAHKVILNHYDLMLAEAIEQPIFPVLQLGISSLKSLSGTEKKQLLSYAKKLIASDKDIAPNELFIYLVLFRHLNTKAGRAQTIKFHSVTPLLNDIQKLFSFLAEFTNEHNQDPAFDLAVRQFSHEPLVRLPPQTINHNELATAIFKIEHLAPMLKRNVLRAIFDLFSHDEVITNEEVDWIRMLADCWDCPVPLSMVTRLSTNGTMTKD